MKLRPSLAPVAAVSVAALSLVGVLVSASAAVASTPGAPPATRRAPVTDVYHGVSVVDDYRWLEAWSDPAVKAWSEAQNVWARATLDALPGRDAIRARVTEIMSAKTIRYRALSVAGERVFAMKSEPPKQQPFLVVMGTPDAPDPTTERIVVDPGVLDPKGTTSIDWFVPSPNGEKLAVSISSGGSEAGDVHVFDVATGRDLNDTVPRVNGGTAGGSLAWAPDGKRFYYTRYPRGTERPEADQAFFLQVYSHTLGEPTEKDTYEIGKDFPRIAEIQLAADAKDGRVLATVQKGDGGEFALYVRSPKGAWQAVADFPDRIVQAALGPKNGLFVISRQGAPLGKLQHLTLVPGKRPDLSKAHVVVAQGADTLVSDFWNQQVMVVTPTRLYLTYQLGGPSEIRVFDHKGKTQAKPAQPPVAAAGGLTPAKGDRVLFETMSYIEPAAWSLHDPKSGDGGKTTRTALAVKPPVDYSDSEVVREFAVSKDGTKVPVNIIRRKGLALDGTHPVVITGYGGYAISMTPGFSAPDRVLVEQGFVLAEANIRGGAEFGTDWHDQGRLTKKQNVFDDFAAAVRLMTARGYTKPEHTVIIGGSNGGLLMGATFTQNPKLCHAVVSFVGMYDMLRSELSANGEFNVPEFGTVKDLAQFTALHAYSPYHHVVDGTRYPDVLFLTGANDPRVDPAESRKMTARMQAASPASRTLLRTSASSGHGLGTALAEKIEETVDVDAFIFGELGIAYRAVK